MDQGLRGGTERGGEEAQVDSEKNVTPEESAAAGDPDPTGAPAQSDTAGAPAQPGGVGDPAEDGAVGVPAQRRAGTRPAADESPTVVIRTGEAQTEVIPAGVSLFARPGSGTRAPVDDAPTTELPTGAGALKSPGGSRAPATASALPAGGNRVPAARSEVPPDESPTAVILNVGGAEPPTSPPKTGIPDMSDQPATVPIWRRWPVLAAAGAVVALAATVGAIALSGSGGSPAGAAQSPAPVPSPLAFSLNPESARPSTPATSPGKRSSGPAKGTTTAAPQTGANPPRNNIDGTNLALGKPATASSSESAAFPAGAAVDGNPDTRWSSAFTDPQWIVVDLGGTWRVSQVRLVWERAYAINYEVDLSLDGTQWSAVFATNNGTGGTVDVDAGSYPARYVRMRGTGRSGTYGYSLFELEVR